MLRRWGWSVGLLAAAALVILTSTDAIGVVAGVVLVLYAIVISPLVFPRPLSAAQAQAQARAQGSPILYWRPGCPYCLRLRFVLLGRADRLLWVDIWKDPQAAAAVRAVAEGNETVPTLMVGADAQVNPDPWWVRDLVDNGGPVS